MPTKTTRPTARAPSTARGEATRRKILQAAEQEFGSRGFHAASVAGITAAGGVAQGTFYIYFPSKEAIFRELVRDVGRQLRQAMREATRGAPDRLSGERRGLEAFVRFISAHPQLYRIVQEANFVDEQVYRDYYNDLARGYARVLENAAAQGELRPGDAEVRAWAVMGMGHFLGLRYCLWQGREPSKATMDAVMDFIAHGMAPDALR